ncbi:MAG: glutamate--tRNA ligase, partial [Methanomethylophilus sp.]
GPKTVFITEKDSQAFAQNKEVRLKDLCNLTYGTPAQYAGNDTAVLKKGVHAVQWVSRNSVPAEVLMPDGTVARGLVEETILHEPSNTVQFERFGFVKLEQKTSEKVTAVYTHN